MLQAGHACLCAHVLIEFPSEGGVHHLDAPADAQDRNLAVGRQACQQQFLAVAPVVDAVQLLQRLFAQEERVDVASACEQQSVDVVEGGEERVALFVGRDDEGCASGT